MITRSKAIIDIVRIHSLQDMSARSSLWATLSLFWSDDTIDAWKKAVSDAEAAETCANLMSMTNMARGLWSGAFFALRLVSVSDDSKTLKCQFDWLHTSSFNRDLSFFPPPVLASAVDRSMPDEAKLWDMITEQKICSGDYMEWHTDDPVERPLPSFHLLHMRWMINRVLAMSGLADFHDEYSAL